MAQVHRRPWSAIAQYTIGKESAGSAPVSPFCSKDQSRIKLLYWDRNGFWLFYKRFGERHISAGQPKQRKLYASHAASYRGCWMDCPIEAGPVRTGPRSMRRLGCVKKILP